MRYKFPYTKEELVIKVNEILSEYDTSLTLRQIYYRLVSIGLMNAQKVYKNLSDKLARARENGLIPWSRIIDTKRHLEVRNQWIDVADFYGWVKDAYARDLQQSQPRHIEVWCEKAVAIQHIMDKYGISLLAGGGYRSASALYEAAKRFKRVGKPITVLYLGDFDPSGLDIERDIEEKLLDIFGIATDVVRVLLNFKDITEYNLLPSPVKKTDPRTLAYIDRFGFENAYELDALPPKVIEQKLETEIRKVMDLSKYEEELEKEAADLERIENELEI